jgi:hypothetical protein
MSKITRKHLPHILAIGFFLTIVNLVPVSEASTTYNPTGVDDIGAVSFCVNWPDTRVDMIIRWEPLRENSCSTGSNCAGPLIPNFSISYVNGYTATGDILANIDLNNPSTWPNYSGTEYEDDYDPSSSLILMGFGDLTGQIPLQFWVSADGAGRQSLGTIWTATCNAGVNVSANLSGGSWTLGPIEAFYTSGSWGISGSGLSSDHVAIADEFGVSIGIMDVTPPTGYTVGNITSSDNGGASMMIYPGQNKTFAIEFIPSPTPPPPIECPNGMDGSSELCCPAGYWNGTSCGISECPNGMDGSSELCCPAGYWYDTYCGISLQCPFGPKNTEECPCPVGTVWQEETWPFLWLPPQSWTGGRCVPDGNGGNPPPPPPCPLGTNGPQCQCSDPMIFDSGSNSCIYPPGTCPLGRNGPTCQCWDPMIYEEVSDGCIYPPGSANATIRVDVTPNISAQWVLICYDAEVESPLGYGDGAVTATVSPEGSVCELNPSAFPGYNYPPSVINSKESFEGNSMIIYPGDDETFFASYTLTSTPLVYNLSVVPSGDLIIVRAPTGYASGNKMVEKVRVSGDSQPVGVIVTESFPSGIEYSFDGNRNCAPTCQTNITFNVFSTVPAGTYPVTITGSPSSNNGPVQFNLIIQNPPNWLPVSCTVTPKPNQYVNQPVAWRANYSGAAPGLVTVNWQGSGMPIPARGNPYTIRYSTVGLKTAVATVVDSAGNRGSCLDQTDTVRIIFDPTILEI